MLDCLDEFDQVLVMTVEPGFGGQAFQPEMLGKIREVRGAIGDRDVWLQVDGGIGPGDHRPHPRGRGRHVRRGSSVFGDADPDAAVRRLRGLATA